MGMTVQQAAQASPNPTLAAQGGQINAIGSLLIGETANAYEPMIEQYLSRPVVLEVVNPADLDRRVAEYHGCLAEYSAQFVMLIDVRQRFVETVPLDGSLHRLMENAVEVRTTGAMLTVASAAAVPVVVEHVTGGGAYHEVARTVGPGERAGVPLPAETATSRQDAGGDEGVAAAGDEAPAVTLAWERTFDLIVPRSVGIIRHASEAGDATRSASPRG
jgi:hypothetical protein